MGNRKLVEKYYYYYYRSYNLELNYYFMCNLNNDINYIGR